MQTTEPVRRNAEIEEFTNLNFIHPIANRLTLLLRDLRVHPNAVSLTGMACGLLAGVAYFHDRDWRSVCLGFLLMVAWHVMDGADGQLARLTHKQSETGRILDGVCDYVTFIAVYTSLAIRLSQHYGALVWPLVVGAGICHAIQSGAYEVQRQEYEFWGYGRLSKDILKSGAAPTAPAPTHALEWLYEKIQFAAIGPTVAFHRRLATILAANTQNTDFIRAQYRALFAPHVRHWSLLCANYRTLGIFLCTLLGAPIAYFIFEIIGFTTIMALLTWRQATIIRRFLDAIGA